MIKLDALATIMSVTWSKFLPNTSIPFTSSTSSLMAKRPVLSAKPPGTRRLIKIPGRFIFQHLIPKTFPALRIGKRDMPPVEMLISELV
uniref:Uncharacterized protein n=1 Tax=Romanomermis culicivorax TaxID=13658 RepID=A0A915K520_ROMCU